MASNRRSPGLSHRLSVAGPSTSSAVGAAYSYLRSVSPSPLDKHGFGLRSPPASPGCLSSTARSYLSAPFYQPPSRTRSLVNRISSRMAHSEVLRQLPPVEPIKTLGEKDRERYLSELNSKDAATAARRASDVGPAITVESELEDDYEDEEYEDEEEEEVVAEPEPTSSTPAPSKKPYWISQSVEEEPDDEEYEDEEEEDEFADEEDYDIEPDEEYDEIYEADETDDIGEEDFQSSSSVSAAFVLKLPPDKAKGSPERIIPPPRIYIDQIPSSPCTPERIVSTKAPPILAARSLHEREQTPAPLTFARPVAPPVPPKPSPSPVYSARNMTPPAGGGSTLTVDETDDLLDEESDWEDEEWEDEEEEEFSDPEDAKAFRIVTELIQKYQETQYQNGPFGPVSASTRTFSSGVATISTHNGQNGTTPSGPDRYKMLYEKEREENERLRRKLEEAGHHDAQQNGSTRSTVAPSRSQSISEDAEKRAMERRIAQLEYELEKSKQLQSDYKRLKDENGALIRVISKLSTK